MAIFTLHFVIVVITRNMLLWFRRLWALLQRYPSAALQLYNSAKSKNSRPVIIRPYYHIRKRRSVWFHLVVVSGSPETIK